MKDILSDLVGHIFPLGNIGFIKVTGDSKETSINAIADDKSVVIDGKFKVPVQQFIGVFGLPNLQKLNVILNIPEYKEDAKITVISQKKNEETVLVGLHFENKAADFSNDYRFMSTEIVNEKLKTIQFNGAKWNVVFAPEASNIQRFKFQTQANSEEIVFVAKTDNKHLKFYFGDPSSHTGEFVFQSNVSGTLSRNFQWPVAAVTNVLSLVGDKEMKFSDAGAMMITVDSGIAAYNYIFPAHTK